MARQVICNVSPTLVYGNLIEPALEVPESAHRLTNAKIHGLSGFVVYLGLDASPESLGLTEYGYFVSESMDTDSIFASMGRPERTEMAATNCLNAANPDCSPPGTTVLSITTLYHRDTWCRVKPEDYVQTKNRIADDMIRQFEEGSGIAIRDHIEEIEVATPATFARYAGARKGVIYGYELEPWDSLIPRALALPGEQYFKGLEFTGGYASMAHGFSGSLLSGRASGALTLHRLGVR